MNDNESTELLIYAETVQAGPNADLTRHDDCAPGATSDQAQGNRADLESADLDREDLKTKDTLETVHSPPTSPNHRCDKWICFHKYS